MHTPLRRQAWALLTLLLAAIAVVTSCSSDAPTTVPGEPTAPSTATQAPAPTPAETPVPTPTPRPTPPPTAGPLAPVTRITINVSQPLGVATVTLGTLQRFSAAGLRPLERITVTHVGPSGPSPRKSLRRSTREGVITWQRALLDSQPGTWTAQLRGETGTRFDYTYTIAPLPLHTRSFLSNGTTFSVYDTPKASFFFYPEVSNGAAALVAQYHQLALNAILPALNAKLDDVIDYYLMPNLEKMTEEVKSGGATIGGYEAGVSLFRYQRSGIYIDMSSDPESMTHVVVHEMVHQITGRLEGNRQAPLWFIEGLADHLGHQAALPLMGDDERLWRRVLRQAGREAITASRWVDLNTLGDYDAWHKETDAKRIEQYYAESYATMDYIARTYGNAVLPGLFEKMADKPKDLDGIFKELFQIDSHELQARVRDDILKLDDFELRAKGLIDYTKAFFGVIDETQLIRERWNAYIRERESLPRATRAARVTQFLSDYRAMRQRLEALRPPGLANEGATVGADAFHSYESAMEAYIRFEQSNRRADLDAGNENLSRADNAFLAGQDLLIDTLTDNGIREPEVFEKRS